ncbi:hypothetical protein [Pseudomonas putida]|uniref:hypothetical protein n=1 Tax=Pseudomonas putida TaxID=303 RepID=UPI001F523306|nr:hypothetical protein [Pseudomonas putida]MCI0914716.1 hypothetical protein [Pseudomonas putida]
MAQAPNIIGDQKSHKDVQKYGVTLHNMPVYPSTDVSNAKHPINEASKSGKRYGAVIMVSGYSKPVMYTAAGSKPTDAWIAVTNDGADIVPAVPA